MANLIQILFIVAATLYSSIAFSQATIGSDQSQKKINEVDCILTQYHTDSELRLITKNGRRYIAIFDELRRISSIQINDDIFKFNYDPNQPNKPLTVVSSNKAIGIIDMTKKIADDRFGTFAEMMKLYKKSSLRKCGAPGQQKVAASGPINSLQGDPYTPGPGQGDDIFMATYWEEQYAPDFEAAYNAWANNFGSQSQNCVSRVLGCNDACDNEFDHGVIGCTIIGGLLAETGPLAVVVTAACLGGITSDKRSCKAQCPSIAGCF